MAHSLIQDEPGIGNPLSRLPEQGLRVKWVSVTGDHQRRGGDLRQPIFEVVPVFRLDGDHQIGWVLWHHERYSGQNERKGPKSWSADVPFDPGAGKHEA